MRRVSVSRDLTGESDGNSRGRSRSEMITAAQYVPLGLRIREGS